jgi:hypothetical protein
MTEESEEKCPECGADTEVEQRQPVHGLLDPWVTACTECDWMEVQ